MKYLPSIWFAASLSMAAGAQLASAESPRVFFIEPKDGALVISPFTVKFGLEGMALKPAGDPAPNSGHHH